ncbi:MAG TPA: tRNA (guanosine(37)-N1)-methyltransferase TrmD [Lentisphaeria bacterium]|nr:MAG: tRNA (guanosine(37)-N1)-methyltransferase TrmD [Lentisphaerae bacterium GWF2_49_21]HBC89207.1 tRNA (guanosine(37)-N1)-methyltransferase TrmD [Lentisphaeria bacterium]
MRIDIITIFPQVFFGPFAESVIARAVKRKIVEINTVDLRDFTHDKHRSVDDKPYGGGPGMLMTPEPIFEAVESLRTAESCVVLPGPGGEVFTQKTAMEFSKLKHLIFLCGHYEGIDERVREGLEAREISIGDYVLTNGNLAAMVMVDAVVRLMPGVLGSEESGVSESFSEGLLEYPQYTRPEVFRGMKVPDVLLSGNHGQIEKWRKEQALRKTKKVRPDLIRPAKK